MSERDYEKNEEAIMEVHEKRHPSCMICRAVPDNTPQQSGHLRVYPDR